MPTTTDVQPEATQASRPNWTTLQCWGFRVVFVYFVLDALPDLLLRIPGGPSVLVFYWNTWNVLLPFFAGRVLHVQDPQRFVLPVVPVLLGDFAGAYVLMLIFLLLAVMVATIWTLVVRHRPDHRKLHGWLRVYVRYALAFSMLGYGVSKLFSVQFGPPLNLVDLTTPFGMLQPRELLWNYMRFSRTYQVFTGAVECLGVMLLFSRRTTLLGALILIGALTNVLVIDIAYEVSVRRIAFRLLLMALLLAAADWRRLTDLFLLHRPAGPLTVDGPSWQSPWTRRTALAAKIAIVVGVIATLSMEFYHERSLVHVAQPALSGMFSVQRMVIDGRELPPQDSRSWSWLAIDDRSVAIGSTAATWERRRASFDDAHQSITLSGARQTKNALTYTLDGESVIISGVLDGHQTQVVLRVLPAPAFVLQRVGVGG